MERKRASLRKDERKRMRASTSCWRELEIERESERGREEFVTADWLRIINKGRKYRELAAGGS